jgi:hypothetical protein
MERRQQEMHRLLVWGEALMRSMSDWPASHPNEFTDWKEDWRKVRRGYERGRLQAEEMRDG